MIEIVLDGRQGNTFMDKPQPVYNIVDFDGSSLDDYRVEASKFIKQFADIRIIIVNTPKDNFSINLFALALFIESCHIANDIDCAVFKVDDDKKALEEYKPFVALTIAIKYIMRICQEDIKRIYHEFTELGYLGLEIDQDFLANKIVLRLDGGEPLQKIITNKTGDAIAAVGMLKALSLAKTGANIEVEINEILETDSIKETDIINKIVNDIRPWIK